VKNAPFIIILVTTKRNEKYDFKYCQQLIYSFKLFENIFINSLCLPLYSRDTREFVMQYRFFLVSVFIVFLVGAGFSLPTREAKTFTVGGKTNYCVFYVPSGISKPAVVFYVHGAGGSGPNFEKETLGDTTANKEKFIAVYPSAANNDGTGTWDDMYGTTNFPFFKAVLDTLDKRYSIDRDRVYMTGFSQGGMISFAAGCSFSDVFAAVAPVSGHTTSTCKPTRPISVFMTFGTQDYGATSTFLADLNIWLKLDSCPNTPTITQPYSNVTRISYGPCAQGTYVVADSILGGSHIWPELNKVNQSNKAWAFFKQFTLKGPATAVHRQTISMARDPISISYSSGVVRLQGIGEKCPVRVIDTKGRLVATAIATQGQFAFNDKPSGVYMVLIRENNRSSALKMILP
jgi:poly(3-hydroxybutyrate) depolymerase